MCYVYIFIIWIFVVMLVWFITWPSSPKDFRVTQVGSKFYITTKKLGFKLWYCAGYDAGFGRFDSATTWETPQEAEKFIDNWIFQSAKSKYNLKNKEDIFK